MILALGDYMNVQCHSCIGGTNVGEDIRKLDYGQHVVSGTPGRVFGTMDLVAGCSLRFRRENCKKGIGNCQFCYFTLNLHHISLIG